MDGSPKGEVPQGNGAKPKSSGFLRPEAGIPPVLGFHLSITALSMGCGSHGCYAECHVTVILIQSTQHPIGILIESTRPPDRPMDPPRAPCVDQLAPRRDFPHFPGRQPERKGGPGEQRRHLRGCFQKGPPTCRRDRSYPHDHMSCIQPEQGWHGTRIDGQCTEGFLGGALRAMHRMVDMTDWCAPRPRAS